MAHTPTPWTYRFRLRGTTIEPLDGDKQLAIVASTPGIGNLDTNAAFIVQACNAHEELLAACRNALDALYLMGDDESHLAYRQAAVKELEAAIAKAQQQEQEQEQEAAP